MEGYRQRDWKGPDWYRIVGEAGSKLAEAPVNMYRCGVYSPGWLYGGHPTVSEGEVVRFVNFVFNASRDSTGINVIDYYGSPYGSDAYVSSFIKVINCNNEYFVYYLIDTPKHSNPGYCTEGPGCPFCNPPCFDFL